MTLKSIKNKTVINKWPDFQTKLIVDVMLEVPGLCCVEEEKQCRVHMNPNREQSPANGRRWWAHTFLCHWVCGGQHSFQMAIVGRVPSQFSPICVLSSSFQLECDAVITWNPLAGRVHIYYGLLLDLRHLIFVWPFDVWVRLGNKPCSTTKVSLQSVLSFDSLLFVCAYKYIWPLGKSYQIRCVYLLSKSSFECMWSHFSHTGSVIVWACVGCESCCRNNKFTNVE